MLSGLVGEGELVSNPNFTFIFTAIATMTAGSLLLMWLGDQITERGIGNGISLIIAVNIVASLPGALVQAWKTFIGTGTDVDPMNPIILVILIGFFFFVIASVIAITEANRRITIQYAKRVVGRKMYGGVQYMPLKVNYANVMPIIFANAIMLFPTQILSMLFPENAFIQNLSTQLIQGWPYYIMTAIMIFFFSYFWVAIMFQPKQIADDLKRNGGYIPGRRPGKPNADYLDYIMSRLTLAGAVFLTVIAILPIFMSRSFQVPSLAAQFFGGTSLLILVGVLLEIMRQIETHLISRHYDGFLRKGRIKGKLERTRSSSANALASKNTMLWLYVSIGILIIIGTCYMVYKGWKY